MDGLLNDTWSDYGRRHRWTRRGDAHPIRPADADADEWDRLCPPRFEVTCDRCGQHRLIAPEVSIGDEVMRWGCPRVPWTFRLGLWLNGQSLPLWSVNSRPPWLPA